MKNNEILENCEKELRDVISKYNNLLNIEGLQLSVIISTEHVKIFQPNYKIKLTNSDYLITTSLNLLEF